MDFSKTSNIQIIELNSSHITEIIKIQEESDLSYWSHSDYVNQLENINTFNLTALLNNEMSGFLVSRLIRIIDHQAIPHQNQNNLSKLYQEAEIYNIAVKERFQNLGIGGLLLKRLFEKSVLIGVEVVWLEVRETNFKALSFYQKHGFKAAYKRKNYYNNPVENAVVMKANLKSL